MNKLILMFILFFVTYELFPQDVEQFILTVKECHPGIIAGKKQLVSKEAEYRTGNTPPDPEVSIGYFPGIPSTAGEKITWSVSQSFDFPSTYTRTRKLKKNEYEEAVLEYDYSTLILLQEARSKAIEYIALEKKINICSERLEHLQNIERSCKKLIDQGEATIIEYNKARLSVTGMENKLQEYRAERDMTGSYLNLISNNNAAILDSADYPLFKDPDIEHLLAEKRDVFPVFGIADKQLEITQDNINLALSGRLPELKLGFASEIVAATQYTGPTIGMTLPLWKNKGKVEAAKAKKELYAVKYDNTMMIVENEIRSKYNKYLSVRDRLETLRERLKKYDPERNLYKALEEGEITIIEYFTELFAYYESKDRLIDLEKDYYLLLSELYDHFPGMNIVHN